jgi:signal transduction histidine kinase
MITVTAGAAAVRSTTAIADARDTAQAFLEGLQQPAVAPDAADTVVLVVSEFVTNALRHGGAAAHWDRLRTPTPSRSPFTIPAGMCRACAPLT